MTDSTVGLWPAPRFDLRAIINGPTYLVYPQSYSLTRSA